MISFVSFLHKAINCSVQVHITTVTIFIYSLASLLETANQSTAIQYKYNISDNICFMKMYIYF